jgi:queuine tRNA-ribosyltransferase
VGFLKENRNMTTFEHPMSSFTLLHTASGSKSRAGTFETAHGSIETPIFMPVGTAGTVKAVEQRVLKNEIHAQIILGNTYHLYLRPGTELLEAAGGLHGFIQWNKPLLTDSGGYQVYSLGENRKISEEGVTFKSHIDGSSHLFTPESVMGIQRSIGADIIMAFDECTPYPCELGYAKKSLDLTHRWLQRCRTAFGAGSGMYGYPQCLFPIVQGSVYPELRAHSAEHIAAMDWEGIAIGGLSVGEPVEDLYQMTDLVTDILPQEKARYLMGVGTPANLIECIDRGIDFFDCVMPTRNARNGMLFTSQGIINIRNERWKNDLSPIDPGLSHYNSNTYSKAYLRHLVISGEILGAMIASEQNLSFYLWLVQEARKHILEDTFTSWKEQIIPVISRKIS